MEDIAQVFKKSSTIALSKTFYYVNDKMAFEIRSRVAFFFFRCCHLKSSGAATVKTLFVSPAAYS